MNHVEEIVQIESYDENSNKTSTECSTYDSFEQGLSDPSRPESEQTRSSGNAAQTFPNLFQSSFGESGEQQNSSGGSISGKFFLLQVPSNVYVSKRLPKYYRDNSSIRKAL